MSFFKQPVLPGDVILEKIQSVDAEVSVPVDTEYAPGTPLVTNDGGATFAKAVDADGVVVNGILGEYLTASGTANVLVTGTVREAHVPGLTDRMRTSAFANKIIFA